MQRSCEGFAAQKSAQGKEGSVRSKDSSLFKCKTTHAHPHTRQADLIRLGSLNPDAVLINTALTSDINNRLGLV